MTKPVTIGRQQITPACRELDGNAGAFDDAVRRAKAGYLDAVRSHPEAIVELRLILTRPATR